MATPADAVAMLRRLLAEAPAEVREALDLQPTEPSAPLRSLTLPGALFAARLETV
jgi:hypothetical protein